MFFELARRLTFSLAIYCFLNSGPQGPLSCIIIWYLLQYPWPNSFEEANQGLQNCYKLQADEFDQTIVCTTAQSVLISK